MLLAFHLTWSLVHTLLSPNMPARIQYTRELLLHWRSQESPADLILPIPVELLRPKSVPEVHSGRLESEGGEAALA